MHYAWRILVGCCFLQAGALGLVLNSAGVFFSPICQELGFAQGGIAAYLTCYSWATCIGMLLVARFFPRIDTRISMSVSAALVIVALGAMSTYHELWQWYVSGVIFGLAGSFLFIVPAPILIANWFSKKTGMATGIAMAFSGIGAAVFSPLLTWLIGIMGWRSTYLIAAGIMAAMVLPFTLFVFRFSPEKFGMKPYGWEEGLSTNDTKDLEKGGVPLRRALPTLAFVCLFVLAGLSSCFGAYNNQFPNFALTIGETTMFGATLISVAMVGNISSKIIMGFVSDVIGVFSTTIIQIALIAASMVLFALSANPIVLYAAAFLYGFQSNIVSVSIPMLIKEVFGAKNYTEIFSFIRIGTGIIGGIGITFVASSYDVFGAYTVAFYAGVGICILAALCVLGAKFGKRSIQWKTEE